MAALSNLPANTLSHTPAHTPTDALLSQLMASWDNFNDLSQLIHQAIVPDPPISLKEGGVIQEGYLAPLDELRRFQREGKTDIAEIERTERGRTGIESLKIRYNQVFGYSIEVSETHLKKIPPDYIRKQTLARAERFTTERLSELEARLLGTGDKMLAMEASAFEEIGLSLAQHASRVQKMSFAIATLDVLAALAEAAHHHHYVRPDVDDGLVLRIFGGRHPVIEQVVPSFVSNDVLLDPPAQRLLILTGPNMAGKSTYMRQLALIVLMAQMGSFVPATEAVIGVTDQIFTRVGAQDDLSQGMSTFMVEMTEVAYILRHATTKSLLLLDEIGRGTSTYDGISIAWAIAEHVYALKARTLFATHYHELTSLAATHEGVLNFHTLVREWNDEIIFLRRMIEGGADRSYGVQVARLAGLPTALIQRAREILTQLEEKSWEAPLPAAKDSVDLFQKAVEVDPVILALREIDPLTVTPLEAVQILFRLCHQAKNKGEGF